MNKKGFTLIELVIVVGLLTTLILGVTAIFRPMIATFQKSAAVTDLKDKAQAITSQFTEPLKTAGGIVVSASGSPSDYEDEYRREALVIGLEDGYLVVRNYPDGPTQPLYSEAYYDGYRVNIKLSTVVKDYNSPTETISFLLVFNKNGEKYRSQTAVECLNIPYQTDQFSLVLSEGGYIAIQR